MALDKREAEIPLNGGMNTSAGAEYQSVDTLRNVLDLRINADGEYEKVPVATGIASVTDSTGGAFIGCAEVQKIDGLVESRGEVYGITRTYGVLTEDSKYLGGGGSLVSAGAVSYSSTLTPVACRVGRLTVDRSSASNTEQGFQSSAACTYASTTLVLASCSYASSGNGCILRLQALDIKTGAVVAQIMYDNDIVASTRWAVDACENTDASAPGAVITWAMGNGAPYTIRKYRYLASTKTFVYDTALTTDASAVQHRIKTSPTAAGRFILAFNLNTGNVLRAYDIACTAGTIGTAISSHAGTHSAGGGIDIAISGTKILLASVGAIAAANSVYAEQYGTPGTAITVATAAGTDYYQSIAVARETSQTVADRAIVWATYADFSTTPLAAGYHVLTEAGLLDFSSTTVVETIALGSTYRANVFLAGFGVTHNDRAFCLMGMAQSYLIEEPSALWVRGGEVLAGTLLIDQPVARVAHDIFRQRVQASIAENLSSTFVVGDTLYSVVTTDPSEDTMESAGDTLPQTLSLVRCEIGLPVTSAKKDGVATVASGVMFDIDGQNALVTQHLMRPVVQLDVSAGTGQTGTFLVTAITRWTDAAGREHRSAPAVPVSTGAIVNKAIDVYVSKPPFEVFTDTLGVRTYTADVYITADAGSTYYLANTAAGRKRTAYSDGGGYRLYSTVLAGVSTNPQPYSMGDGDDALVSEPPPSPLAIATIGDRMWMLDAEDRTRIWFSKPFEDGYAAEWNTANTLTIGDEGVGISDVGGIPTVFAERGIWQIFGDGPNNLGVGTFAPARRLPQEVGCLDPLSVCKTSLGVFFRARQGVMLLGNDGSLIDASAAISGEITVTGDPTGYCRIAYDDLMGELHVIDFDETHWVLHLGENKWAQWTQVSGLDWRDALSIKGRMYFCSEDLDGSDIVHRQKSIDETDYQRTTLGWSMQTPWIRFDGVTGNMRIWEVIVQVRLSEPDANRTDITVTYATREGTSESFYWTAAQLATMGEAGDIVNLRCRVADQRTKQFRCTLTEAAGSANEGSVPIAIRVLYGVTPGGDRNRSTAQNKGPTVPS